MYPASNMETSLVTEMTGLNTQQQLYAMWILMGIKLIGTVYGAITNGGGLKKIFLRLWLGNTVPVVVAQDYREISTPKTPVT